MNEYDIQLFCRVYEIPRDCVIAAIASGATKEELRERFSFDLSYRVVSQEAAELGYRLVPCSATA
jgi:hypothetical protein